MARVKARTSLCSEEELRAVIDAIPAHVWSNSPDGEVEFLNRRVLEYFGLHAEDMRGWNWQLSVHPDDLAQFVSDRRAAFASGQALDRKIRLRRADGQYRWWLIRHVPQRNKSGEIVKWYGVAFDMEDKRHAEEAALEQRLLERTRIARELHDTLLQSFQAVLLKLHVLTYQLSDRPELQRTLEDVIGQAREAVTEGRDAVQGLRSSTLASNDLARAISLLCDELTAHHVAGDCPEAQVHVGGTPRELVPILRDDIYRTSGEAVRNAFLHAQATRVEVEIGYDARQLRVRVRDNGKGIDPKILESGAREGHYGLPGMCERAKLVGGKLTVRSELNSGTEIDLTIPASLAYVKSSVALESTSSKKSA